MDHSCALSRRKPVVEFILCALAALAAGCSGGAPNGDAPGESASPKRILAGPPDAAPGLTDSTPGQTGQTPGQSGQTPGQDGAPPPGLEGGTPVVVDSGVANGPCTGPSALNCDDANVCTTDSCVQGIGCVHTANSLPCLNHDPCRVPGVCSGGVCTGGGLPINCNDGNPCTIESCSPFVGCVRADAPNGTACTDANLCNGREVCINAQCVPGVPLDCDDRNACTADTCDPLAGCAHETLPDGTSCDDRSACTVGDACVSRSCVPGPPLDCDDGNECTGDRCLPASGCIHDLAPPGLPCDDGNICTDRDGCIFGQCQPGAQIDCDDNNPCTDDGCTPGVGCGHIPTFNQFACSDHNACNGLELCVSGGCVPGTTPDCDDGNGCTADACSPGPGCTHTTLADGSSCDRAGRCGAGECTECVVSPYAWPTHTTPTGLGPPNPPAADTAFNSTGKSFSYVTQGSKVFAIRNVAEPGCALGDCAAGGIKWQVTLDAAFGVLSPPAVVEPSHPLLNQEVVLVAAGPFLVKLDAETGAELRRVDTRRRTFDGALICQSDSAGATPTVQLFTPGAMSRTDDLVFVATVNGCGDETNNRVIAYWLSNFDVSWTFNAFGQLQVGGMRGGCLLADPFLDQLYCGATKLDFTGQRSLFVLNPFTGVLIWMADAGNLVNRPVLFGTRVYVSSYDGTISAFDQGDDLRGNAIHYWTSNGSLTHPEARFVVDPAVGLSNGRIQVLAVDTFGAIQRLNEDGDSAERVPELVPFRLEVPSDVTFTSAAVVSRTFAKIYAGRSDGRMEEIDLSDNNTRRLVPVKLGARVGTPTLDVASPGSALNRLTVTTEDSLPSGAGVVSRLVIPFCSVPPPFVPFPFAL